MGEKEYTTITYHIEVSHNTGNFKSEMDLLTPDLKVVSEQLKYLKDKYKSHEIKITQITETKSYQPLPESQLEQIINFADIINKE